MAKFIIERILHRLFGDIKEVKWSVDCYLQTPGGITKPEHPLVQMVAEAIL